MASDSLRCGWVIHKSLGDSARQLDLRACNLIGRTLQVDRRPNKKDLRAVSGSSKKRRKATEARMRDLALEMGLMRSENEEQSRGMELNYDPKEERSQGDWHFKKTLLR